MFRLLNELDGYEINAQDGRIGKASEFYFDDRTWTIRYLVVDTGKWLSGKKVLISPVNLHHPDWEEKIIPVEMTRKQIEESPDINADQPVYRQKELELMKYYGWPDYWESVGAYMPENALIMSTAVAREALENKEGSGKKESQKNPHLRSSTEVVGYHILALKGEIGHIDDFIVEDKNWVIRYVVVDTKNWLPWGKKVLVSPSWIERIKWAERMVHVDLSKDVIEKSPEFDPDAPVNRDYENRLFDYYGREKYWDEI